MTMTRVPRVARWFTLVKRNNGVTANDPEQNRWYSLHGSSWERRYLSDTRCRDLFVLLFVLFLFFLFYRFTLATLRTTTPLGASRIYPNLRPVVNGTSIRASHRSVSVYLLVAFVTAGSFKRSASPSSSRAKIDGRRLSFESEKEVLHRCSMKQN